MFSCSSLYRRANTSSWSNNSFNIRNFRISSSYGSCKWYVVIIIMPLLMMKGNNVKVFEKIDFMLPKTIRQRVAFFFIVVTAGVCEEIIFRGASTYLLMNIGVELPLWVVGVIGAVLFGLAHWYQGITGIVTPRFLGYVMFNLYVQTGSLLVPIVLHFLIDVKFVFMPD